MRPKPLQVNGERAGLRVLRRYAPEPNPETAKKDVVWFALNEDRPLFAFAGIWTTFSERWLSRYTKAMPVILTEGDVRMRAPWDEGEGAAAAVTG
jgi:hypothetical protein